MPSDIRYARSGDVSIAYLVHGAGPIDLVSVHGAISHLEIELERPEYVAMLGRFARYARLLRSSSTTLFDSTGPVRAPAQP